MAMHFMFLKEGTLHYTPMKDKCNVICNLTIPKRVKDCVILVAWSIFCDHFF